MCARDGSTSAFHCREQFYCSLPDSLFHPPHNKESLVHETVSHEDNLAAVKAALQLIGNASSKVSLLRRERITGQINKSLLPLANDESNFLEAAPTLFGTELAKSSKDYIDCKRCDFNEVHIYWGKPERAPH